MSFSFSIRHLRTCLLAATLLATNTSCTTVTSKSGVIDKKGREGHVRGNLYYLPRAQVRITGEVNDKAADAIAVTIKVDYVPDTRYRYYLDPTANIFYDDEYKLHVDSNGLLETVNMVAEDKTGAILGDLAKIAANAARFNAGIAPTGRSKAAGAQEAIEKPEPFDYTFFLDEADTIKPLIRKRGFDLEVSYDRNKIGGAKFTTLREPSADVRQTEPGVVFRPGIPCRITITDQPFRLRMASYAKWGKEFSALGDANGALTIHATKLGEMRSTLKKADGRETELLQLVDRRKKELGTPAAGAAPDALLEKYQIELGQVQAELRDLPAKIKEEEGKTAALEKAVADAKVPEKAAQAEYRRGYVANTGDAKGGAVKADDGALIARMMVIVPDEETRLLMRMGRTPFVKRTDNLVFAKGLLTKVEGTRPSPVLGFLQIPKTILETIAPLPLELRQTRVNNINQQRTLEGLLAPVEAAATPAN